MVTEWEFYGSGRFTSGLGEIRARRRVVPSVRAESPGTVSIGARFSFDTWLSLKATSYRSHPCPFWSKHLSRLLHPLDNAGSSEQSGRRR